MYSTERLVTEVQKYPCIWDMTSSEYADKDLKYKCWIKVAEDVYDRTWNILSAAEQGEKVKELKNKKWRHVRDAYLKHVTEEENIKNGLEGTKRKPYAYAELMSFMNVTVKKRKITDTFKTVDDDTISNSSQDIKDIIPKIVVKVPSTRISTNQDQKFTKQNQMNPLQSNLLEQSDKNQETASSSDINIVMSFLPHMKLLNDEQKLDFQLNGLQYLKNIINQK